MHHAALHPPRRCPSCNRPLTTDRERRENVCRDFRCRGPRLQQWSAARRERVQNKQRALETSAKRTLKQTTPDILKQTEAEALLLIVVPGIESHIVPPSGERIADFRRTLEASFEEAEQLVAHPQRSANLLSGHDPHAQATAPLPIVNACSTCRGWCCRMGRPHAYLQQEFLAWRLIHEHDLTSDDMIEDYLERIPEQSQDGSCVYHTSTGCALPRSIRSSTCNSFLCPGLSQHRDAIEREPQRATAVVSVDDPDYASFGEISDEREPPCVRVGVMNSDGDRSERRLSSQRPDD